MTDEEIADYDGTFDRFVCPSCTEVFEVESDARGATVRCDACGWEGKGGS